MVGDTSGVAESDPELVRRVQAGDGEAFTELYRRYAPSAYGLALRVLRQPGLAQDVVHDSFAAIWGAPEVYDPARGAFRSFLLSLVHHRAVDIVRREERLRERERRLNLATPADEDWGEAAFEAADLADRRQEVRTAIGELSPEQREVIELAYFQGYTQARIAAERGIPLGTVKTRTMAAMRKLRERLR
jgi:RNA polymerase sigma-70 factor (ECF subfamily)